MQAPGTPAMDIKSRTASAYNAAADTYDDPALAFWDRYGRATIDRVPLKPGMRVLDACCGSGASALPAADKVGPDGQVIAVDLAHELLRLGRSKAAERGITNVRFRLGDVDGLGYMDHSFDAVICVFGIFFFQDMAAAARELWRLIRPGGFLAITTWGPELFEPVNSLFWESVREIRSDLYKSFNPWDRINTPVALSSMLASAGIQAEAAAEAGSHPLKQAEEAWRITMGSGYRGIIDQLTPDERLLVEDRVVTTVRELGVTAINAGVVYALAEKPTIDRDIQGRRGPHLGLP